jgi:hypothetical protein
VVPSLCRPGERPDPLQERARIAAGLAAAISEKGHRDQAYGLIECPSRGLHQDLTIMASTGPTTIAASWM